ncbi:MAG: hypothetical protein OHK93_003772 [Ramalina farinacea]|uniref:RING-type E3 ubiquitin transferase n=1 Tax=Ramalina farinacea TaxID=258253 RepID=A0AA43TYE0_9LECA|nr:hypothetical protein [Ramalina farinacea]
MDLNAFLDSTAQSLSLRSLSNPTPYRPSATSNPPIPNCHPATTTINSADTVCNICQESYNQGTQPEIPLTLPCGHAFGSVCIAQWLHVRKRDHGCPICRNMPFGTPPPPNSDDLEDGEITDDDDEDDAMSSTSDSDEPIPGFSRNRAFAEYWNNGAGLTLAQMGEELSDALRHYLGRNRSTELLTQMVRTGDTRGMQPDVVTLLLSEHGPPADHHVPGLSYRQATARQYAVLKAKVEQAAVWLHGRATDYVLQELLAHLDVSQRECAQGFLAEDREALKLLFKAAVLQSRRMEGSFELRLGLAQRIPGTPQDLDDWCKRYVHRMMEALPALGDAYESVVRAQRYQQSTIPEEMNFKELWDADMALEPLAEPSARAGIPGFWGDFHDSAPPPRQLRTFGTPVWVEPSTLPLAQAQEWSGHTLVTNNDVSQTSVPPSDPTPSSVEQQRERVREAAYAYARNVEQQRLAANDPLRLPSLAELEDQARQQIPPYVVEPRESFVRNGAQRRNGISEGRRTGR